MPQKLGHPEQDIRPRASRRGDIPSGEVPKFNGARISRIRTLVKKVEAALATGDKEAAATALQTVQPELARGVARGVLHKNTAARKFGRLTKAVSALG